MQLKHDIIQIFTDASVKPNMTGLGLAIKDARGGLIGWRGKRTRKMTCNEAEYAAIIFALELAPQWRAREVRILSDSRVVVEQMQGVIGVHNESLQVLNRKARSLMDKLPSVNFAHIPRERNELADAMAEDVCHRR